MRAYRRPSGVSLEPLGTSWAAFSPLSGASHLLNRESAAIIEALDDVDGRVALAVCEDLAAECDVSAVEVEQAIGRAWDALVGAGLIIELRVADEPAA